MYQFFENDYLIFLYALLYRSVDAASGIGSKIAAAAPAGMHGVILSMYKYKSVSESVGIIGVFFFISLDMPAAAALVGGTMTTATTPRMTPISNVATSSRQTHFSFFFFFN